MWRLGLEVRFGGLVGRLGWEVRFGWCSYAGEVQLCRRRGFVSVPWVWSGSMFHVLNLHLNHICHNMRTDGHRDMKPVLSDAKLSIYGGSYSGQKSLSRSVTALFAYL